VVPARIGGCEEIVVGADQPDRRQHDQHGQDRGNGRTNEHPSHVVSQNAKRVSLRLYAALNGRDT